MRVGVAREIAPDERRVALVPETVGKLAAAGFEVVVEPGAGEAASFPDESLDWVYIDADHAYEGVKRDLEAYFRVVKPGGFIAGDDYGHVDRWFGDGVRQAVDEFAGRCAELTVIGTQFLLRKP